MTLDQKIQNELKNILDLNINVATGDDLKIKHDNFVYDEKIEIESNNAIIKGKLYIYDDSDFTKINAIEESNLDLLGGDGWERMGDWYSHECQLWLEVNKIAKPKPSLITEFILKIKQN